MQSKRPVEAQNAILRRHFLELTQSFMIPLVSIMTSNDAYIKIQSYVL